jgi:hypothetical protein
MDSSFDTLREALDSDMVNKGWIPGWVPHEATDLREVHDLDSNTSALAFTKPLRYHCSCLRIARQRHSAQRSCCVRSILVAGDGTPSRRTASLLRA